MRFIISFFKEKQYRIVILLNIIFAVILLAYLNVFGKLASKYTLYVFVAPLFLIVLFNVKNILFKILLPLGFLIFVENTIISSIPVAKMFRVGGALIFAMTALLSILYFNKREKLPKRYGFQWAMYFLFVALSFVIGSTVSANLFNANVEAIVTYYFEFFLYFYLGYLAFKDVETVKKFLFILIVMGFLSAVGHIFSLISGVNLEAIRGSSAVSESRDVAEGHWRYGGFFGNVNTMSAFYVMMIPASLYLAITDKSVMKKSFAVLNIMTMILSLLMGASRGGLLFVVANMLVVLFFVKIKLKNILVGGFVIIVIGLILNFALNQFFMEYISRAFDEMSRKGTDSPREVIWAYTVKIIADYPFGLGVSTYNFSHILRKYGNIFWSNPHNMYLEMITQTGFGGLIFFLSIVIRTMLRSIKSFRNSINPDFRQSLTIIFLNISGFMMMGFTEPVFRNQYKLNHIFAILLGLSVSLTFRLSNLGKEKEIKPGGENTDEAIIQNR